MLQDHHDAAAVAASAVGAAHDSKVNGTDEMEGVFDYEAHETGGAAYSKAQRLDDEEDVADDGSELKARQNGTRQREHGGSLEVQPMTLRRTRMCYH